MKNPDMKQLALLSALIESQSLTEAARRLEVTPSGASQALNRLREIMGDPLCSREGNGWQLTPFGETAMGSIRAILDTWAAAHGSTEVFDPSRCDAHLAVACHDGFGESGLADFCQAVLAEAPHMTLDLVPAGDDPSVLRRLREGNLDVAVCSVPPPRHARDLRFAELNQKPLTHVCLSGEHPRIGRSISLAQYLAEDHVEVDPGVSEPGFALMNRIDQKLTDSGLTPRRLMRLPSWALCAALLPRTPHLVTTSEAQALALCREGRIRMLPLPHAIQWPVTTPHLVWHERNASLPHHRWARELLLRCLQADAETAAEFTAPPSVSAAPVVMLANARRS